MKSLIRTLKIAVSFFIAYLLMGFVSLDFNLLEWEIGARGLLIIAAFGVFWVGYGMEVLTGKF